MGAESLQKSDEGFECDGGEHEGNAEPERIDGEQSRAAPYRLFRGRDGENGCEDRTDTGRPAERKSKAHHISAPEAERLFDVDALFAIEKGEPKKAQEMEPHENDRDAGKKRQRPNGPARPARRLTALRQAA